MTKQWEYIGQGRNRDVWRRGNYVIKVPINIYGLHDNWHERQMWAEYRSRGYIKYAACRLIGNFFLLMEYAGFSRLLSNQSGYIPLAKAPDWAYSVDCNQVGYNKRGQIVAYDYGIN